MVRTNTARCKLKGKHAVPELRSEPLKVAQEPKFIFLYLPARAEHKSQAQLHSVTCSLWDSSAHSNYPTQNGAALEATLKLLSVCLLISGTHLGTPCMCAPTTSNDL